METGKYHVLSVEALDDFVVTPIEYKGEKGYFISQKELEEKKSAMVEEIFNDDEPLAISAEERLHDLKEMQDKLEAGVPLQELFKPYATVLKD